MDRSENNRPNILFIMSDDHAYQAITAYNPTFPISTPGIDRLAKEGARLDRMFCTNSICAPSRACILTGNYNHLNGVRKLDNNFNGRLPNVAKSLQDEGYQTAIIGKWHLGVKEPYLPTGFDHFEIFVNQGEYYNPRFITDEGIHIEYGYATELVTEKSISYIKNRDKDKPFFLMCHHKAPHRNWQPSPKYKNAFDKVNFPHPETYNDDYESRGPAASKAAMRIDDLTQNDFKEKKIPKGTKEEVRNWKFQHYLADYTACIASVDDSVAELLESLEEEKILDNTVVIYCSDQGFYMGEHGWFDKRFIYEESLRMPFLIRYPKEIEAGSVVNDLLLNIDFADTFLDYAGARGKLKCQGESFRNVLKNHSKSDCNSDECAATARNKGYDAVYYRYWDAPSEHYVFPHSGVRTERYKLAKFIDIENSDSIYYELYDLEKDPNELHNIFDKPEYSDIQNELFAKMEELRIKYEDNDPDDFYKVSIEDSNIK